MTISVNDGKTTPQAHVFSQDREQNGSQSALFVNRVGTAGPMGWETIEESVTLAKNAGGDHVRRSVLKVPKIGIKDGAPYVIGSVRYFLTRASSQGCSSEDDLADADAIAANWLANATVKPLSKKLAPIVG